MGDFKHLVVAKFKEGVFVDEIIKGMQLLVSQIHTVNSFEWGQDLESEEMLRQGFTHSFLMAFSNKDEFNTFLSHPKHLEFSTTFSQAIEKVILLDFPAVLAKPVTKFSVETEPSESESEPKSEPKPEPEPESKPEAPAPSVAAPV